MVKKCKYINAICSTLLYKNIMCINMLYTVYDMNMYTICNNNLWNVKHSGISVWSHEKQGWHYCPENPSSDTHDRPISLLSIHFVHFSLFLVMIFYSPIIACGILSSLFIGCFKIWWRFQPSDKTCFDRRVKMAIVIDFVSCIMIGQFLLFSVW